MGGLITVISTVVIKVTEPELGNTLAVVAGKFSLVITFSVVTHFSVLIRSIKTISISITLEIFENALAVVAHKLVAMAF